MSAQEAHVCSHLSFLAKRPLLESRANQAETLKYLKCATSRIQHDRICCTQEWNYPLKSGSCIVSFFLWILKRSALEIWVIREIPLAPLGVRKECHKVRTILQPLRDNSAAVSNTEANATCIPRLYICVSLF